MNFAGCFARFPFSKPNTGTYSFVDRKDLLFRVPPQGLRITDAANKDDAVGLGLLPPSAEPRGMKRPPTRFA